MYQDNHTLKSNLKKWNSYQYSLSQKDGIISAATLSSVNEKLAWRTTLRQDN